MNKLKVGKLDKKEEETSSIKKEVILVVFVFVFLCICICGQAQYKS